LSYKIKSLITARGGSKGIPFKNIVDVGGKPLISYSIEASLNSSVDETWVSTDDEYIKKVAEDYGAKVIDRPKELAGDVIMPDASLLHFAENNDFNFLVFIQPTSPLLKSSDINMGINMMEKYDSVFSGYKEEWTSKWSSNMKPINWNGIDRPRRQDADDIFVENGAFYITSKERLLDSKCRYSGNIGVYEMSFYKSFQIDTLEDLKFIRGII
tara:strand:- start:2164 stop:2802 length:639 start_codon:yes stop_codon:yes gene_type:complete